MIMSNPTPYPFSVHSPSHETHRIGFVSTRFSGTDGVSLETEKWAGVLRELGHELFFFAGLNDKPGNVSYQIPEANFYHPEIQEIYEKAFSMRRRPRELTLNIHRLAERLADHLANYVRQFEIDLLVVQNALAIPMNIPLGLALTEFIAETGIPTIAHHHDFFWERKRFLVNCVWDYLNMAFPPHLPSIRHVVINTSAQNQLSLRTGISSMLIPNVMDFEHPPQDDDHYADELRQDLNFQPDELFILQPTRVVQRKGIENAIELVRRLGMKARLVISHASGDEGYEYERHVRKYAELLEVPVNFVSEIILEQRSRTHDGQKIYSLADAYQKCDLVTYPSTIEGFGNAFLEAIYFRKPVIVNNYSIFSTDIKPKGFNVIEFDGFITEQTIEKTRQVLQNAALRKDMIELNYALGVRFFSFAVLKRRLETLISDCFGE
ncbi:MAG: glycosyltransferase family 4 protein [Anaerolineales bacterium]|jgi:glycosyltransferase involved in cell wall biosynthesis|nr:glycosyltransferase family 4 protein [Anaerolineales bacterium]